MVRLLFNLGKLVSIHETRQFKKDREEKLQKDIKLPWSLSYGHLLETPSHNFLQMIIQSDVEFAFDPFVFLHIS
jgi:hypothetical protein